MEPHSEPVERVDVLIVGAGLSGIGAAAQLRRHHPHRSVLVLEARESLGGTWDYFRYPGLRSDSDMFTFGYRWAPWRSDQALTDGATILDYLRRTAREHDVEPLIRYRTTVVRADWNSAESRWRVEVETPEGPRTLHASVLWGCSGYYDYRGGHQPDFPGLADYTGRFLHPQTWSDDLDWDGKRVVVIGSGATAVTLVPELAKRASSVTMLQRSPTYIAAVPARDPLARLLRRLPYRLSYPLVRWKNILQGIGIYRFSRRWPDRLAAILRRGVARQLPPDVDVDRHFRPDYDPWDQRLCAVPDGDLFAAIRAGRAEVVTDVIDTFTADGIRLASGAELAADIVVSATGLRLRPFGGIDLRVDGEPVKLPELMSYKALMLSGVPNFVFTIGYTNASWTLKADLVSDYLVRLLRHLDETGRSVFHVERDPSVAERPFMDFSSGYVQRALPGLPRQGDTAPWLMKQNYLVDRRMIQKAPIEDGVLRLR